MLPSKTLSDLIPDFVLQSLRDRIKAGVSDAETKFSYNRADEDAVTGALAQAISTAGPVNFHDLRGQFSYEIGSYKLRGRGPGAPEKHLGADGILQISVALNGKTCFSKGLPFQAKMTGGFGNQKVRGQAQDLWKTSGTGVIIRFSDRGYTGADVREILRPGGVRKGPPVRLAALFGDLFLDCEVGRQGLIFDQHKVVNGKKGTWVINAVVECEDFTTVPPTSSESRKL